MQQEILAKHTQAKLKVYTVWFSMLFGDSRSGWRSGAMPDARVTHLWDEKRIASQWFSQQIWGETGNMWDTFLLYGPDAEWASADSAPMPLVSSGSTVVRERDKLESSLIPLLK